MTQEKEVAEEAGILSEEDLSEEFPDIEAERLLEEGEGYDGVRLSIALDHYRDAEAELEAAIEEYKEQITKTA